MIHQSNCKATDADTTQKIQQQRTPEPTKAKGSKALLKSDEEVLRLLLESKAIFTQEMLKEMEGFSFEIEMNREILLKTINKTRAFVTFSNRLAMLDKDPKDTEAINWFTRFFVFVKDSTKDEEFYRQLESNQPVSLFFNDLDKMYDSDGNMNDDDKESEELYDPNYE